MSNETGTNNNIIKNNKYETTFEENTIKSLKNEIMILKMENSLLRKKISKIKSMEKELNDAKEYIKFLNNERKELMLKQNEEIKKYKIENQKLLNDKDFHDLNYKKRLIIFEQKTGKVHELELENEVYKEELNDLKEQNKKLGESTNIKIRELEHMNKMKFKALKKEMLKNLTESKEKMLELNLERLDIDTKLIHMKNNELIKDIDEQNKSMKKLINEKKNLKIKLLDLENQKEIDEKIKLELAYKLNTKKNNSLDVNLFNKKNINKNKNRLNFKKTLFINNTKNKFLDSNIFNEIKTIKHNNIESYTTKKNSYNTESLINSSSRPKYKHIIAEKNREIENLNIKLDNLKNRFSYFNNKYKRLYKFLDDCLNDFFWEIKGETNYNINYDKIKKFNFEGFNSKEKYAILVLVMNHLLPIITFNFYSNCNLGTNIFTTNINIYNNDFNKVDKFLNNDTLKKSFLGKNNKIQKDLYIKKETLLNGTIPVLRKKDIEINNILKEDKYKFIL